MDKMTILITGGTGYLGRNLIKRLLFEQYKVIALVRLNSDTRYLLTLDGHLTIYRLGETSISHIFDTHNIQAIIHTAANYGRKGEGLIDVVDANLYFPLNLLDLAIQNKVKYFINTDTSLPKNLNIYAYSKKQFLEWLEFYSGAIRVLNLQLEYFYGPNDDPTKFITFVLQQLKSNQKKIDFTPATPFRDFIYIDDVIDAYVLLLTNLESIKNLKHVEIGSGEAVMLKDIIIKIQQLSGFMDTELNFGALPMRDNEIMMSCADITYLKSIGWAPKHTLTEGILKTIKLENK